MLLIQSKIKKKLSEIYIKFGKIAFVVEVKKKWYKD